MSKMKSLTFFGFFIISLSAGITPAKASLLQLSHDPLFLNQTVPPAIAVTLDDSGSMAWGYLGTTNRRAAFTDPAQNLLYYNPNIVYSPPIRADGSQMPQINPKAAPLNGYHEYGYGTITTRNLTNNYTPIYQLYYYQGGSNSVSYTNNISEATNNGKNTRAFYLTRSGGVYTEHQITDATELDNFANWYSYYNTRMKLARAAISRAFAGFGPSFKVDWQLLNKHVRFDNGLEKFESTHRADFYSFLFSAPSDGGTPLRSAFVRAGELFKDEDSYKSDDFNTSLSCQQNFHIAVSDGGWNGSFSVPAGFTRDHNALTTLPGDTGTTNEPGPRYKNYHGTGEQKIFKHSYNNNIADIAFHYWANDLRPAMNNNVKRFKKSFIDSTGAAIDFTGLNDEWEHEAFVWNPKNNPAYWQHLVTHNVGMGLEASLVVNHMNSKTSCTTSTNTDPKQAIYEGLRNGDCDWPASDNENTTRIDDVWHSSINSRGEFFGANDPDALVKALNDVVNDILERLSRGSTSTISSGVITNDTLAFSPGFDSSKWSGNLIAREVKTNATFGDVKWDAACVLTGGLCSATGAMVTKQANRNIYTYDTSLGAVPFNASLPIGLKNKIQSNGNEVLTRTGASVNDVIDYVNGNQNLEISKGGVLRNRTSLLADIVHSSPAVVRGPSAGYQDSKWPAGSAEQLAAEIGNGYLDFQIANQARHNVLYVGSNSGMLHAFDAQDPLTTEEYWGYIPSKAVNNIHRLIDPQFKHWSFVDNTPEVRDAFFNNKWNTVLIGGMRYGGQSYYALDVTDGPANKPKVLWEFSDEDDADMGYSYGHATIVRISSTGDWVALIPNGYNNSQPYTDDPSTLDDNHVSQTGHAVLFVVRLSDGQLLAKLDTGVGSVNTPNGLAPAIAVDSEFSPNGIDIGADFAYAGDLYGNLWRFNFISNDYSDWSSDIKRIIKADNIKHRPITVQPRVVNIKTDVQSKEKDVLVMFGTGKYIEIPDRSINLPATQYMVGVVDGLDSTYENLSITDGNFVQNTFTMNSGGGSRNLSDTDVDYSTKYGWKVPLPDKGERLANPLTLLGNQILLATTTVTAGIDPCEAGGRSWLSAFNPYTGGTTELGEIFEDMIVGVDGDGNPITVVQAADSVLVNDLIIGKPALASIPGILNLIVEGTGGEQNSSQVIALKEFTWRRRNWTNLLTE